MSENCHRLKDKIAAETIYMVGKNSPFGDRPGLHSLQNFGHGKTEPIMSKAMDPAFAFQIYGLADGNTSNFKSYISFAHDTVMRAFNDDDCDLAVETALIMTLWMKAAHSLWDGFFSCAADSDSGSKSDNSKYFFFVDSFIAVWVGSLQSATNTVDGYSLYSATQKAAQLFRTGIVALANSKILDLYEVLGTILSETDACTSGSDTAMKIWRVNNEMMSLMMVPLIQLLIDSLYEENEAYVRLYGSMVVPQLSQCRHSTYIYLKESILENEIDGREFKNIYNSLTSTFECLNLRCEDIGTYVKNSDIKCNGDGTSDRLAGYPMTTRVRQVAKIDIDIHQMKILMKFDDNVAWDLAASIYKYGKNSKVGDWSNYVNSSGQDDDYDDGFFEDGQIDDQFSATMTTFQFQSLQSMATSDDRHLVNIYIAFLDYFRDADYADSLIMKTFVGDGYWGSKPREDRAAIISITIQTSVIYMEVLNEMRKAVSDCKENLPINSSEWDEVAALIIGSLEGTETGGSDDVEDGQLLWNIGNKRAFEFGKANREGYAISNEKVLELLFAGKGELTQMSCRNLNNTAERLSNILLIPVMQSVIEYARINEGKKSMDGGATVAIGEAFSYAVLPIVKTYNTNAAEVIENNMIVKSINPMVEDGPQVVADALNMVVRDFGIECSDIGKRFNIDTCMDFVPNIQMQNDAVCDDVRALFLILGTSFALIM